MAFIHGTPATAPISPYAGLHPVLAERAKTRVATLAESPATAIEMVQREHDDLEKRLLDAPWDVPECMEFCRQRLASARANDPTVTLVDIRAGVYTSLRRGGVEAARIVGIVTGVTDGEFRALPNGELVVD